MKNVMNHGENRGSHRRCLFHLVRVPHRGRRLPCRKRQVGLPLMWRYADVCQFNPVCVLFNEYMFGLLWHPWIKSCICLCVSGPNTWSEGWLDSARTLHWPLTSMPCVQLRQRLWNSVAAQIEKWTQSTTSRCFLMFFVAMLLNIKKHFFLNIFWMFFLFGPCLLSCLKMLSMLVGVHLSCVSPGGLGLATDCTVGGMAWQIYSKAVKRTEVVTL